MNNIAPFFSIIVPTLGRTEELIRFSQSVLAQSYESFEVICIDQNESFSVENFLKMKDERWYFVKSNRRGLSFNRNIGIQFAIGKFLLFLDDDCIISTNYLETIYHSLQNASSNDMYYTSLLTAEKKKPWFVGATRINRISFWTFDRVCSVSLVIPRNLPEKILYFDEDFGLGAKYCGGEESELVIRLLLQRIRIIKISGAEVYHPEKTLDINHWQKSFDYGFSKGVLYRRYMFKNKRLMLRLLIELVVRLNLIGFAAIGKKFNSSSNRLAYFKGIIKGIIP